MFDYEGSRSEFLKILTEMGEEPAFLERARAPEVALTAMVTRCEKRYEELRLWPRRHYTAVRRRVRDDWSRLSPLTTSDTPDLIFKKLADQLPVVDDVRPPIFTTLGRLLGAFIVSARRFNTAWDHFIDDAGLENVNRLRTAYNKHYPMEKACAFGSEIGEGHFRPLPFLDRTFLTTRFPTLALPTLANDA